MKRKYFRWFGWTAAGVILITFLGAYAIACCYVYLEPSLPSAAAMRDVDFQVPLRVYTRNGGLIAEIGDQRRIPVKYDQIPKLLREAFLAAEDDRFFQHHGIDYRGVLRAAFVDLMSGDRAQGASTITMQTARNMFLTLDKTWRRKLQETFLTYRMEDVFTKQQIFDLYLNRIFFGQRAYGVVAAAQTYFGKPLAQLTIAQDAMLAGLPQAPSRYNPIANPQFARDRRTYVLRRMRELGFITPAQAAAANATPIEVHEHAPAYVVQAHYVAQMALQDMLRRYGPRAENAGYKVFTTIDGRLQSAANRAVRLGLIEYDRRHGWRGATAHVKLPPAPQPAQLAKVLDGYHSVGLLQPAVVVRVGTQSARVYLQQGVEVPIGWDGLSWARRQEGGGRGPAPKNAGQILSRGDIVYVVSDGRYAQLAQIPQAQAALAALDPDDGAVAALVGGFDYFASKYNRATMARRQPGSGFKPFLYSAALEDGFTAASVLPDAPVVLEGDGRELAWRPENDSGRFNGPTRLREALVHSRNLVTIRLLRRMGTQYAIDYATRFGFDKSQLPNNLTLALGTLQTTPLQLATAYATFANGGFLVHSYFIDHIVGPDGQIVWQAHPATVCAECDDTPDISHIGLPAATPATIAAADAARGGTALPAAQIAPRVISAQNAWLMDSMMKDVIKHGTGVRALVLHRDDIAGKTGTTNQARDAWFNGFTSGLVATVWVGFDQGRPLGSGEEGAHTALPIWIDFMRDALEDVPEAQRPMPNGLVTLHISPQTGRLVSASDPNSILETFMVNHLPQGSALAGNEAGAPAANPGAVAPSEPLF